MSSVHQSLEKLEQLARELEQRGEATIARQIAREVVSLREQTSPPKLMTPDEAAEALGVRSANMIRRWARDGKLEGYRQDGRIVVSARSVAGMSESPLVARERAREREFDEAMAPFCLRDDEELDPEDLRSTWIGRKPWATSDSARS